MKKSNKEYAREREADGVRSAIAHMNRTAPKGGVEFDRGYKRAKKLALPVMRRALSLTQHGVPRVPPVFSSMEPWFGSWPEQVHGACETNNFGLHQLWLDWAIEAADLGRKNDRRVHWDQQNPGTLHLLHGELFDTNVSLSVVKISGHLVLFWECVSAKVDWHLASDWIRRSFPNTAGATGDAMNFHNVITGLRERK